MDIDVNRTKNGYEKDRKTYHVEICQKNKSALRYIDIKQIVKKFLLKHRQFIPQSLQNDPVLRDHIEKLTVYSSNENLAVFQQMPVEDDNCMFYYVYRLYDDCEDEMLDEDDGELPAATNWLLPSKDLADLWDSLIYDTNIKHNLVNYATTGLLFADKGVNTDMISWNRVVLLHGPPGTGKTSLCHALAHKLSIRLSNRFSSASLLEVNSHSLFSKWFSESGKLIMKMFKKVEELVEDENHLVFLLIDEVESLTAARASVSSGVEPSDAIRVVNALLTQVDQLKRYKNVLVLTTSNVTGKIDVAFVDRADIRFFVGLPSPTAVYHIYKSCIDELGRVGLIQPKAEILGDPADLSQIPECQSSNTLLSIATASVGLSGRTLRKLPFLAFSSHLSARLSVTFAQFAQALSQTVDVQFKDREKLSNPS